MDGEDANGCIGQATYAVTVNQKPVLEFVNFPELGCEAWAPVLIEVNPTGGLITGEYIVSDYFYVPQSSPIGVYSYVNYFYTDNKGCSNSITDSVYIDICEAISEYSASVVKMYPNPVKDILQIDTQGKEINSIEIYNTQGQLVLRKKANVIDVKEIPTGVYSITVITREERVTKRFVKE